MVRSGQEEACIYNQNNIKILNKEEIEKINCSELKNCKVTCSENHYLILINDKEIL